MMKSRSRHCERSAAISSWYPHEIAAPAARNDGGLNRLKIICLAFALISFAPWAVAQPSTTAKDDMEQIDEPEEADSEDGAVEQKRAPAENPKTPLKLGDRQEIPPGWGTRAAGAASDKATPAPEEIEDDSDDEDETTAAPKAKWIASKLVKLQGLNKVTAKTVEINSKIGDKIKFSNLEITVEKCLRGPDGEKPDNTALMTIFDGFPGETKKQVFHGWMFSSAPALSSLEHPIYDVILLQCSDK